MSQDTQGSKWDFPGGDNLQQIACEQTWSADLCCCRLSVKQGYCFTLIPTRYFTSNKNLKRQIIISYLNASLKSTELIDHRLEARELQRVGTMIAKALSPLVISLDLGKDHKADQKSLESCWWHMTAKVCSCWLCSTVCLRPVFLRSPQPVATDGRSCLSPVLLELFSC